MEPRANRSLRAEIASLWTDPRMRVGVIVFASLGVVLGFGLFGSQMGINMLWLLILYCLPSMLALDRAHETVAGIVALNLLLGWTLIGWIIALVWALSKPRRKNYRIQLWSRP